MTDYEAEHCQMMNQIKTFFIEKKNKKIYIFLWIIY